MTTKVARRLLRSFTFFTHTKPMSLNRSLLASALLVGAVITTQAQLISEPFNYTVGNTLAGSGAWTALNSGTAPTISSGNLSVSGLSDSSGASVLLPGGNHQEAVLALGSTVSSGSLYFSIALNVTSAPTGSSYIMAHTTGNTNYGTVVFTQASGAGYQIGLANRSSGATTTYDSTVYAVGSTVFLVGRYDFVSGTGNDTSALWINPSSATFGAGAAPSATLSASGGTDMTAISQFILRGATGSPVSTVDGLRIGTTWASVTPAAVVVPEPSTYAMGLGLLALVGAVWQRQRRRA